MKRALDVFLAAMALLALSPVLLPLMLLLRLTGEGEVFYRQQRVGLRGKHFGLLKFATMLANSPHIGAGEVTLKNDSRILPLGHFLRKSKLNELPQLLNIVAGDMSVVGPRPMVPNTFALYPAQARSDIETVPPGLTGIGSIVFRDEERYLDAGDESLRFYRSVIIPHKAELEQWFVRNHSLSLYFKVIFVTAWVIVAPESELPGRLFANLPPTPDALQARRSRRLG